MSEVEYSVSEFLKSCKRMKVCNEVAWILDKLAEDKTTLEKATERISKLLVNGIKAKESETW